FTVTLLCAQLTPLCGSTEPSDQRKPCSTWVAPPVGSPLAAWDAIPFGLCDGGAVVPRLPAGAEPVARAEGEEGRGLLVAEPISGPLPAGSVVRTVSGLLPAPTAAQAEAGGDGHGRARDPETAVPRRRAPSAAEELAAAPRGSRGHAAFDARQHGRRVRGVPVRLREERVLECRVV